MVSSHYLSKTATCWTKRTRWNHIPNVLYSQLYNFQNFKRILKDKRNSTRLICNLVNMQIDHGMHIYIYTHTHSIWVDDNWYGSTADVQREVSPDWRRQSNVSAALLGVFLRSFLALWNGHILPKLKRLESKSFFFFTDIRKASCADIRGKRIQ